MLKTKSFVTRMVVIVAFTQAVLLSALVTVLVSLTAAEGIPEPVPGGCPYPNNANHRFVTVEILTRMQISVPLRNLPVVAQLFKNTISLSADSNDKYYDKPWEQITEKLLAI